MSRHSSRVSTPPVLFQNEYNQYYRNLPPAPAVQTPTRQTPTRGRNATTTTTPTRGRRQPASAPSRARNSRANTTPTTPTTPTRRAQRAPRAAPASNPRPAVQRANNNQANARAVVRGANRAPKDESPLKTLFQVETEAAAFGLFVTRDNRVWMSNQAGDVIRINTETHEIEKRIKLPSGVKSIVSDFQWIYAGCDDGVVYDCTHIPRPAYRLPEEIFAEKDKENNENNNMQVDQPPQQNGEQQQPQPVENKEDNQQQQQQQDPSIAPPLSKEKSKLSFSRQGSLRSQSSFIQEDKLDFEPPENPPEEKIQVQPSKKIKNVCFVLDISGSMRAKIQACLKNIKMIINHHLLPDDRISLVVFNNTVNLRFKHNTKRLDKDRIFKELDGMDPQGATAFWDAVVTGIDLVKENAPENAPENEEKWVIGLTDGMDNRSTANQASILEMTKNDKSFNLLIIGVGLGNSAPIKEVCHSTPFGSYIDVTYQNDESIDDAFKQIAEILSAKVAWMDIRDGIIAVSGNRGYLALCNIEGERIWEHVASDEIPKEKRSGWMVRSDFLGVYQGLGNLVIKYDVNEGTVLWETKTHEEKHVLFGWQSDSHVFAAAGNSVYRLKKENGELESKFDCNFPVVSTSLSYDKKHLYAADDHTNLYCFLNPEIPDLNVQPKLLWTFKSGCGTALSMQAYNNDRLYIVSTHGVLACYDVGEDAIKEAIDGVPNKHKTKIISVDGEEGGKVETVLPTGEIPTTNDASKGVVVECCYEFSEEELIKISRAIFDANATEVDVYGDGKPSAIQTNASGCRYIRIGNTNIIEQNKQKNTKYADMAKAGQKLLWVINEGRWGLMVDEKIVNPMKLRVRPVEGSGFNRNWNIQFPKEKREAGRKFVVDDLVPAQNGEYYRVQGEIKLLVE